MCLVYNVERALKLGASLLGRLLSRLPYSPQWRISTEPKIYSTPELEGEAQEILRRYKDQDFSYTDAVSFALMQREGIEEAFAFDAHFRTMGFLLVP
jgi:predicted nucleic acid-binding protein